jgi:hypothetical protein
MSVGMVRGNPSRGQRVPSFSSNNSIYAISMICRIVRTGRGVWENCGGTSTALDELILKVQNISCEGPKDIPAPGQGRKLKNKTCP